MKILHVYSMLAPPYGWALEVARALGHAQEMRGHQVEIATTTAPWESEDGPTDVFSTAEVTIRRFPVERWLASRRFRRLRLFAVSFPLARDLLARIPCTDIVHIHTLYSFPSVVAAWACRRAQVPYIVSPHGSLDPYTHLRRGRLRKELFIRLFHRRDLRNAAFTHFVSEGERELASSFGLIRRPAVVHLGLDAKKYRAAADLDGFRKRWPTLARKRLVLYLGRISYTKGLDLLVDAFPRLAGDFPDAHLLLVGPDYEGYSAVLRRRLEQLNIADRATFTGMISDADKVAALQSSEVFVMPSYTEAFGVAILEAMACKLPVVVTRQVSLSDLLGRAKVGLVVEADARALGEAIERLLNNPSMRQDLGRRGCQIVETNFTWRRSADELLALYSRAVRPAAAASAPSQYPTDRGRCTPSA